MTSTPHVPGTRLRPTCRVWLAATLLATAASAQDAPERARCDTPLGSVQILYAAPAPAKVTFQLWIAYANPKGAYRDNVYYIEELQTRWRAKGVVVGVIMPMEQALAVAKGKPGFVVLAAGKHDEKAIDNLRERAEGSTLLCEGSGVKVVCASNTLDGMHDTLRFLTDDGKAHIITQRLRQLRSLISGVADGGSFGPQVAACLKALPKSGRAHAAKVLFHWWCQGDLAAGRTAAIAGLEALAEHSLPLVTFADLVLRGDRNDPELARQIATALAPLADCHKHNARVQLVYLRALLLAGNDHRTAGRLAATLPKQLLGRPIDQILFAETLMDAETPAAFRDQAERAINDASKSADLILRRWTYCARHKVYTRSGDPEAAAKLMIAYRKDPVGQTDLNNDAWYLMVQPETMGRFNTLAFAQATLMEKNDGDAISANNRDTLALAYFLNGQHKRALKLQTAATKAGGSSAFVGRLRRYEATVARTKANTEPRKKAGK